MNGHPHVIQHFRFFPDCCDYGHNYNYGQFHMWQTMTSHSKMMIYFLIQLSKLDFCWKLKVKLVSGWVQSDNWMKFLKNETWQTCLDGWYVMGNSCRGRSTKLQSSLYDTCNYIVFRVLMRPKDSSSVSSKKTKLGYNRCILVWFLVELYRVRCIGSQNPSNGRTRKNGSVGSLSIVYTKQDEETSDPDCVYEQ